MRSTKTVMSVLAFALALVLQHPVLADESVVQYTVKQTMSSVGTNLKRDIVKAGTIPLNKDYSELTPDQIAMLKSEYENLKEGDEPPFPVKGLMPMYRSIAHAHEDTGLQYVGSLSIFIDVGADGNVKSIDVISSPDDEIVQQISKTISIQKFKPALCSGQPCEMKFPLRAELIAPRDNISHNLGTAGTIAPGTIAH